MSTRPRTRFHSSLMRSASSKLPDRGAGVEPVLRVRSIAGVRMRADYGSDDTGMSGLAFMIAATPALSVIRTSCVRFAVAVSNGSVNLTEGFPYISQCGTYNPQSCLFAQICNICSVLALFIVVIRFQQVKDFGNHGKANIFSIVLGFLSSVGISIIGNFQQSVLMKIHLLGALLAFFLGLAYFWVQLFLTYRAQPSQDRCYVGPARATCCTLCTILVIVMSILHNTGHSSGAAMCEWALVMLFFCLFGLFATEFRHIDCHQLTVQKQSLENDCSRATVEFNGYVTNASS